MNINIKYMGLAALAMASLSACDLDTTPTTSLDSDNAFKSTTYAEDVLRGTWQNALDDGITYASYGLNSILLQDDFMGSDCVKANSYGYKDSYNVSAGYSRGQNTRLLWSIAYDAINNSNNIIAYIDNADGTSNDRNRIKGQAYATRGYMYMMLASHYSFAIDKDPNAVCAPIYTEPATLTTALTGNAASSVSEVYAQALSDLKQAAQLIPESYAHSSNSSEIYMIDYATTMGLLARTSLYARQWQDAYDYACKALDKKGSLMTESSYASNFNLVSNEECMWGYSATLDDNGCAYVGYFKDNSLDGYGSLCVDPHFAMLFSADDWRGDYFKQWGFTAQGGTRVYLLNDKFKMRSVDDQLMDFTLMRTAEMYLIKAEAAFRLGKEAEARNVLHTLQQSRMRVGKTAPTITATGDNLLQTIWTERRKELWGEGFALTDIIRNQQSIERKPYDLGKKVYNTALGDSVTVDSVTVYSQNDHSKTPQKAVPLGHYTTMLPDNTPFTVNSIYYLYRILETEELQNANLYSKYPKLSQYR